MDKFFVNLDSMVFVFVPELVLVVGIIALGGLYMFGHIYMSDNKIVRVFYSLTLMILLFYTCLSFWQVLFVDTPNPAFAYNSSFWFKNWVFFLKGVFGFLVFCVTYMHINAAYGDWEKRSNIFVGAKVFEFVILLLLMLLGMSICLMSNNLVLFYLSLELQSFCIFILLFLGPGNTVQTVHAGIVYFLAVLVSSVFFLVGVSYLYYRFGSLNLNEIWLCFYAVSKTSGFAPADLSFMLILLLGLFVKVGLFPIHLWVPEVYAYGKIFPVSLIATISKLFGFAIIAQFFVVFSPHMMLYSIIKFVGICSIVHGVLAALAQLSILSLLGYSAIAHMGYVYLSMSIGTPEATAYALFYLIVYLFNVTPVFLVLLTAESSDGSGRKITNVYDLRAIRCENWSETVVPLFLSTFFFSFIGIPPFSGFFAKYYIIVVLFHSGCLFSAFIMGFFSVVSAFYYLKIIKSMFFESKDFSTPEKPYWVIPTNVGVLVIFFGLFNLLFVFLSPYFLGFIFSFCGAI